MPTTFSNGFYGGNPSVSGAGNHHNTNPLTGAREIMQAAYLNTIEEAIETTQEAIGVLETSYNILITGLRTASSIAQVNALASGIALV